MTGVMTQEQEAFARLFRRASISVGGGEKFSHVALRLLGSPRDPEATVNLIDAQNLIRAALREIEATRRDDAPSFCIA